MAAPAPTEQSVQVTPADAAAAETKEQAALAQQDKQTAFIGMSLRTVRKGKCKGVKIVRVKKNGNAAQAGLQQRDIIQLMDDAPILVSEDFMVRWSTYKPGDVVTFWVVRAKKLIEKQVTVGGTNKQMKKKQKKPATAGSKRDRAIARKAEKLKEKQEKKEKSLKEKEERKKNKAGLFGAKKKKAEREAAAEKARKEAEQAAAREAMFFEAERQRREQFEEKAREQQAALEAERERLREVARKYVMEVRAKEEVDEIDDEDELLEVSEDEYEDEDDVEVDEVVAPEETIDDFSQTYVRAAFDHNDEVQGYLSFSAGQVIRVLSVGVDLTNLDPNKPQWVWGELSNATPVVCGYFATSFVQLVE